MTYAIYYKPNGDLFKLINKIQIQFIKKATMKKKDLIKMTDRFFLKQKQNKEEKSS